MERQFGQSVMNQPGKSYILNYNTVNTGALSGGGDPRRGGGVAVAHGIRAACGLPALIKWPNDIVSGSGRARRKLAAVLKGNAYGHGRDLVARLVADEVAQEAERDGLAALSPAETRTLRRLLERLATG